MTAPDTTRAIAQMNDTHTGPSVTCPASRHAAMISEALMSGAPYAMLAEAPEHCGASIADTVAALWEARVEVEQLRAENERLRAMIRVNAIRYLNMSHEDIDAAIRAALSSTGEDG